jgi:hypothetical protein
MNWRTFLQKWEREMLAILKQFQALPTAISLDEQTLLERGSLAFAPATVEQIQELEQRLNCALPPSYKAFLQTTNGWIQLAMDAGDGKLWSTSEVQWFIDQDPQWVEAWADDGLDASISDADYFQYGAAQNPVYLRRTYLLTALAVSEGIDSSVYLLNPVVQSSAGEWEAWWFSNKLPGAARYRSFEDMMVAERLRVRRNLLGALDYCRRQYSIAPP